MEAERIVEPLIERGWLNIIISTAVTLVPLIQCQKFYDLSETDLSNDVFQSKMFLGP